MNHITRRNAIKGVAGLVGAAMVAPIPFLGEVKKVDFPEGKIYKEKVGDSMWYYEDDRMFCICESSDYKVFFDSLPGHAYIEKRVYKKGPLIPPYWDNIIEVSLPWKRFTFTTIKGTDVLKSGKWCNPKHISGYVKYSLQDDLKSYRHGQGYWDDFYWPEKHWNADYGGYYYRDALTLEELDNFAQEAYEEKDKMKKRVYKKFNACFPKERLV